MKLSRRFNQEITLAILTIDADGNIQIEKVLLPNTRKKPDVEEQVPADIGLKIPMIVRDINAGKSVNQIARKYKIPEELSEQINRMYLTHPGVDTDGILRRLEL